MPDKTEFQQPVFSFSQRIALECLFAVHGVGAVGYWWMTPGGFPTWHARFWSNRDLRIAMLAALVAIIVPLSLPRIERVHLLSVSVAGMWIGASALARFVFPISLAAACLIGLGIGGAFAIVARLCWTAGLESLTRYLAAVLPEQ